MLKLDMHFIKTKASNVGGYLSGSRLQIVLIGIITTLLAFLLVQSGATPKKYTLNEGEESPYDITAPRDIINIDKVEEKAKAAQEKVGPVVRQDDTALFEMFMGVDGFAATALNIRGSIQQQLDVQGIYKDNAEYPAKLLKEQERAVNAMRAYAQKSDVSITDEQVKYLINDASDSEISYLKSTIIDMINNIAKEELSEDNLAEKTAYLAEGIRDLDSNDKLESIGIALVKTVLKPIRTIDRELTDMRKKEAYNEAYDEAVKVEKILKGERIISFGELVTKDKLNILIELNLLKKDNRLDIGYGAGILIMICLIGFLLVLYIKHFCKEVLENKQNIMLMSIIIILILFIARVMDGYISPFAIPISIATMLITIMLNYRLAIIINIVLTIAISMMVSDVSYFMYVSLISGTISAFLASKVSQRSRLSMVGLITGLCSALIIFCIGMINKSDLNNVLLECLIAFLNGIISIILTIGMLPFWEMAFNMITPFKLLELANPNQPLIKRLLMEAPGTYNHSLIVGNLAEMAIEIIGGNPLLARVGAYYHDVGKLQRPYLFKENQMAENPHDRMAPEVSAHVILSHVHDGIKLAEKYKIPTAVKDIIAQHHGTTLVVYFYHKALNSANNSHVDSESYRYAGPKPLTREAAIIMLADSVEAAVRSIPDKTKTKIEGAVRKIIKDKLDDGQLDLCDLTLKDLDMTAGAFLTALSGIFHEREEYPEIVMDKVFEESSNNNINLESTKVKEG